MARTRRARTARVAGARPRARGIAAMLRALCAAAALLAPVAARADGDVLRIGMRETPVNDFFAQGGKVRTDGRMVHDVYLMRFKAPSQSTGRWDLYELVTTVPGDEAFRPLGDGGCPYVQN
jgi:hypothetical protein